MIKAKQSEYLLQCKPQLKQLSDILNNRRWLRAGELERIKQATA